MNWHVIRSVFGRDFFSYFSNPTGYVFICAYVVLASLAAFWSTEFFAANLANLDQLNRYYPLILLVFIPAITMSIWADERRQGTDELLLTIPATDVDVVLGKFLAATAIFTVALLYSMTTNLGFLLRLGHPDIGLMVGTHVGYWWVGLAMIGVGMAASFLTPNLTVSYILGALLNAPLVALMWAESWVPYPEWASYLRRWSLTENFRDFSRGVISFSGMFYFLAIALVTLYVAVVLIGRRHWAGAREGRGMFWQFLLRIASLMVIAVASTAIAWRFDFFRWDLTAEKISSLAPSTRQIMSQLRNDAARPSVLIEAYVSPSVPEAYVQTRLNLLSALREFDSLGGSKVQVNVNSVELFSDQADNAEKRYDIKPQPVQSKSRGVFTQDEIFLAVAVTAGTETVVIPFFDRGVPVEYELVRSIATVSDTQRKKLGVLTTDVNLFGGFDFQTGSSSREQQFITELKKQYEVVRLDTKAPLTEKVDAVLAVQPSTLSQPALDNFLNLVYTGVPVAIFEDPMPLPGLMGANIPGTDEPKQPSGGMMGFTPPPEPKGNIAKFWADLGIEFTGDQVIWQNYCPYPSIQGNLTEDFVFVNRDWFANALNPSSPVTRDLREVLFIYPGAIRKLAKCQLTIEPLCQTGNNTGTLGTQYTFTKTPFGPQPHPDTERNRIKVQGGEFVLAARIKGSLAGEATSKDGVSLPTEGSKAASGTTKQVNLLLVGDIDLMGSALFDLRARGVDSEAGDISLQMENVPFILNVVDELTGDARFIDIRSRQLRHRTLTEFEKDTEEARRAAETARSNSEKAFKTELDAAEKQLEEEIKKFQEAGGGSAMQLAVSQQRLSKELQVKKRSLELTRETELRKAEAKLVKDVRKVQDRFKSGVLALPPLIPTLLGLFVFFSRRAREKEGVSKNRLR